MSNPDLVSVVLPTHNRYRTIERAVRSVLTQSYDNLELIVVDDASVDGTAEILDHISDPRLHVIRLDTRSGAAQARNVGVRASRGQFIAFQDSDDEWLEIKLEKQIAVFHEAGEDLGWVGGAYLVHDQGISRSVSSQNLVRGSNYDVDLLIGEPFVTPTWLVRRKYLIEAGLFDESMPCLEDWDLIFKLAGLCAFRAVGDQILIRYGGPDSLFGNLNKRRLGLQVILTRHRDRWLRDPARYAYWCAELGRLHGLQGNRGESLRWLFRSLGCEALQPRVAILALAGLVDLRLLKRLSRSPWVVRLDKLQ